ncbi:hypothetical protein KKE26_02040 [bacterium]|nr:hypothetical protein [bacterium]
MSTKKSKVIVMGQGEAVQRSLYLRALQMVSMFYADYRKVQRDKIGALSTVIVTILFAWVVVDRLLQNRNLAREAYSMLC